jgi:hypothetical protein
VQGVWKKGAESAPTMALFAPWSAVDGGTGCRRLEAFSASLQLL